MEHLTTYLFFILFDVIYFLNIENLPSFNWILQNALWKGPKILKLNQKNINICLLYWKIGFMKWNEIFYLFERNLHCSLLIISSYADALRVVWRARFYYYFLNFFSFKIWNLRIDLRNQKKIVHRLCLQIKAMEPPTAKWLFVFSVLVSAPPIQAFVYCLSFLFRKSSTALFFFLLIFTVVWPITVLY